MTHELIAELYRRYMRGDLTLEDAADQIHILARDRETGLSVFTGDMSAADQERTYDLLARLHWHAMREAAPGADIPLVSGQDFLEHLDELRADEDSE
jgi:hypothetical protein